MFTRSLVTHTYQNADNTPSSGTVIFTLERAMTNGSVTMAPSSSVSAPLTDSGTLTQVLTSTDDPTTVSDGLAVWRVDEHIAGASTRTYVIHVPSGGASADLSTLMPFSGPVQPGGTD